MRPIRSQTRRRPLWRTAALLLAAIVIGGGVTVGALAAFHIIEPGKLAFWRSRSTIPAGYIAVPVSARPIPAFTEVTGEYLINPKTLSLAVAHMPPKAIPPGTILSVSKIRGRVTAHAISANYNFTEDDFLPEGTRPGIVGGTPVGKRAITLDAGKLKGVHDLKIGDHVDLLASIAVDMPGATRNSRSGNNVLATPDTALLPKRSIVRPLVQDGVVVTAVHTRAIPISSSSLMQGTQSRTVPVQEVVLAVDPDEVAPLAEALDMDYEITCVARSGRPAAETAAKKTAPAKEETTRSGAANVWGAIATTLLGKHAKAEDGGHPAPAEKENTTAARKMPPRNAAADITPGLDPMAHTRFMEVMVGAQRQFMLFVGPGDSPVVAMQNNAAAGSPHDNEEIKQ